MEAVRVWELGGAPPARAWVLLAATAGALWGLGLARRSFWLFALLALPGTLAHEACHWLAGRLLNARPVRFTVRPRREGRGFVLGSVAFAHLRWYNAFFIGLAPLLLVPLAWLLLRAGSSGIPAFGWRQAGLAFLAADLLAAAVPSGQDLRLAARSPVGWLLLAAGLAWGWVRATRGVGRGRAAGHRTADLAPETPATPRF